MMRYAVLRDLDDPELRPVALVTEHRDAVRVHFAVDCGLRSEYRQPYTVMEPDGEVRSYGPASTEYFDAVLTTLGRSFVVDIVDSRPSLQIESVVDLFFNKIVLPRATRHAAYAHASVPAGAATLYGERAPARPVAAQVAAGETFLARAA